VQTSSTAPTPATDAGRRRLAYAPLVFIVLAAVALRAWLLFRTEYLPGINGAYYLVQARALLERGALAMPDLPLTFHLHAALAWTLARLTPLAQADAVVWAVKLCDALLPPLVAWPVFVLVRRWARPLGRGDLVPLAAAALACVPATMFRTVGDVQKNSLALVWLALLALTLHDWLDSPTPRRGLALLGVLLLLATTHVGVLGAALVLLTAVLLAFAARVRGSAPWRQMLPWLGAAAALLALAASLVAWRFDPERVRRLAVAFTDPARFAFDGGQSPIRPGSARYVARWGAYLMFATAIAPAVSIAWRRRRELSAPDLAIVAGAAFTVVALTIPCFSMDKSIRFWAIALLPMNLVVAFSVLRVTTRWRRGLLVGLALLASVGGTAASLPRGGADSLSGPALRELAGLARFVTAPDRTLLAAAHGAEWWSAWLLRTRVAQPDALRPDDWRRYDTVLFLEVRTGLQVNPFAGGSPPPAQPGRGAEPALSPPIPADAEILHDGATLRLARVAAPPAHSAH